MGPELAFSLGTALKGGQGGGREFVCELVDEVWFGMFPSCQVLPSGGHFPPPGGVSSHEVELSACFSRGGSLGSGCKRHGQPPVHPQGCRTPST
jgi:hypothetical protein